jgi:hypothetical protein
MSKIRLPRDMKTEDATKQATLDGPRAEWRFTQTELSDHAEE